MPVLTMAVDLGTSFIKAGVYNTDGKFSSKGRKDIQIHFVMYEKSC